MEVQIVSVAKPRQVTKGDKAWNEVEVQFIGKNGPGKRSIKSFEGEVFKQVQGLNEGDTAEVTVVKNGQFWNWTGVEKKAGGGAGASSGGPVASAAPQKKGDWETSEERANKQHYIVRQSSIANAIALGATGDVDEILQIAKRFEDFVFSGEVPVAEKRAKGRPKKEEQEPEEMQ
jgi:predicted RNA-binding protein with TRAM domain